MANLFTKAKTSDLAEKPKKADKKKQVEFEGLERFCAIDLVMSSLEAVRSIYETSVKDRMVTYFLEEGKKLKSRPDNVRGIDGDAKASCEIRKRSVRSVISPDEASMFEEAGITLETQADGVETYIINPKYKDNQELLAKVSEALEKIPGLPDDIIMFQEAKKRQVVSDATVQQVFANPDLTAKFIKLVCTPAIKPTVSDGGNDINHALDLIRGIIAEQNEAA